MSEKVVVVGDRPIREINQEIRAELAKGHFVLVKDTRSRHNLGVGLPAGAKIRFEGSVGYYCGGLNDGAHIEVERNVGWSVGEAMATGEIIVPLLGATLTTLVVFIPLVFLTGVPGIFLQCRSEFVVRCIDDFSLAFCDCNAEGFRCMDSFECLYF